jgi:hypothetical protein
VWLNGGEFTNQGAEVSLTATPVQLRNGFSWLSNISYFRNYSVVNSLPVPAFTIFDVLIQKGRSVTNVVNPTAAGPDGKPPTLGDVLPDWTIDFDQELNYGPFHLSGVMQWNRAGTVMNQTELYYDYGSLWGDSAYAVNWANNFNSGKYNWIEGGGFVKLRSASLSYSLPSRWIHGFAGGRFSSARLSIVGRNLLQWYNKGYTGLDPEVSTGANSNILRNIEVTPYPPSRSYFLSLDVGF